MRGMMERGARGALVRVGVLVERVGRGVRRALKGIERRGRCWRIGWMEEVG